MSSTQDDGQEDSIPTAELQAMTVTAQICQLCQTEMMKDPPYDAELGQMPGRTFCVKCASPFHTYCLACWFERSDEGDHCPNCWTPLESEFVIDHLGKGKDYRKRIRLLDLERLEVDGAARRPRMALKSPEKNP